MTRKMKSEYLFSSKGAADLAAFADVSALYAFDLDGTLAAIAYEPHLIIIEDTVKRSLVSLMKIACVAVVTGRSVSDALGHLGFEPHYLVGNHGAEGLAVSRADKNLFGLLTADWGKQAESYLARLKNQGIVIENKGTSLSIHYRNASNRGEAQAEILDFIRTLKPKPRHVSGKYVENIIPSEAPDKGMAILAIMESAGCSKAFYAGDDETDEDVFTLEDDRIFSVHVGTGGKTAARYYLKRQDEIYQLIQRIIRQLLTMR